MRVLRHSRAFRIRFRSFRFFDVNDAADDILMESHILSRVRLPQCFLREMRDEVEEKAVRVVAIYMYFSFFVAKTSRAVEAVCCRVQLSLRWRRSNPEKT